MAGLREGLLNLVFKEIRNERGFELVDIVQLHLKLTQADLSHVTRQT
jgi:hypothetical protein